MKKMNLEQWLMVSSLGTHSVTVTPYCVQIMSKGLDLHRNEGPTRSTVTRVMTDILCY